MKKVFSFLAIAAMVCMVSCKKDNGGNQPDPQPQPEPEPEVVGLGIAIDGVFEDWAAVKPEAVSVAKNNPTSPWDAVSEIRCCADDDFVYWYIKYNKSVLTDLLSVPEEELPFRLNINTDGEFTSGYTSYSLDGYDFIIEGGLAENGAFTECAGTLYQRVDGSWSKLIESTGGIIIGKGAGNEYEIMMPRELFNNAVSADQKMKDVFYTGIRFYTDGGGSWEELSNMPNSSMNEGDGNGYAHLMEVNTWKVN